LNALIPFLLSWFQSYSYPALWLCIFIAAIGAPLPISLILLASGAFAALGDFQLVYLFITAVTASACGDSCGYYLGRKLNVGAIQQLMQKKRFRLISPQAFERSQKYFQRHGAWAIFLSRCIVPALGGAINLLAGIEHYPFKRFLIYDLAGETISAILPLTLGYTFGASWEGIGDVMNRASLLIFTLLIGIYLVRLLIKTVQHLKKAKKEEQSTQRHIGTRYVSEAKNSNKLTFTSQKGEFK